MSIRLSFTIESANPAINIPTEPVSGEWKTRKVLKSYHNVDANTTGTNKAMFLNIDECENDGFSNSIINLDTYLISCIVILPEHGKQIPYFDIL